MKNRDVIEIERTDGVSVGYLLLANKDYVSILSFWPGEDSEGGLISHQQVIPQGLIKSITVLKKFENRKKKRIRYFNRWLEEGTREYELFQNGDL